MCAWPFGCIPRLHRGVRKQPTSSVPGKRAVSVIFEKLLFAILLYSVLTHANVYGSLKVPPR